MVETFWIYKPVDDVVSLNSGNFDVFLPTGKI